jgi:large subunit ribosomal protein L10
MANHTILEQKKGVVEEVKEIFSNSGVYVIDYRGLTVKDMEGLRKRVKAQKAEMKVVKNRMIIKHFQNLSATHGREIFNGPTALIYSDENFVETAKDLVEFEKENQKIQIKFGFVEQRFVDANGVKAVAKLPSKEQLMGQVAYSMVYPLKKMGMALSAPLRNVLVLMKNLKDKKESGGEQ